MKETKMKFAIACIAVAVVTSSATEANAQCTTCPVPQVAYSPVVYNNYTTSYDGWYLGKYVGRLGRRVFGTAPTPAYAASYAPSYNYPTTYAASYAPRYSVGYAPTYQYASYSPACNSCGTSPCGCTQTTYRPVVMQPVTQCNSCNTCNTCSGVVQSSYDAPVSSNCPTCNTATYIESPSSNPAPSLNNSAAPPQTYRETNRLDPTPAEESSAEQASDFGAPLLLSDPNDKLTKRPTAPVWTAVYKQPATITSVSATSRPAAVPVQKKNVGWTAGR